MKKWQYHPLMKALYVFLASVLLFVTLASAVSVAVLFDKGGYTASWPSVREEFLARHYAGISYRVAYQFASCNKEVFKDWLNWMEDGYGFSCEILNPSGYAYFSDYTGKEATYLSDERIYFHSDEEGDLREGWTTDAVCYRVKLYGYEPREGSPNEAYLAALEICHRYRYYLLLGVFLCGALFILLMILICYVAGKKEKDGEIRLGFWSRVPAEIVIAFWITFLALQIFLLDDFVLDLSIAVLLLIVASAFLAVDCILCVLSVSNLAIRIKAGMLLQNTIIWRIWNPLSRVLKKCFEFCASLWKEVRLEPKVVLILASVAVFDFFLATVLDFTEFLAAVLIEGVILSVLLVWYAAAIQLLHRDLSHRVEGKLEYRSDLSRLPPGLRSFGEDLNRSAEGMEKALEEKMKSERFKTELITGVSHDIKTPLTSIVNYVDLMKKEEIENEKILEYLEVLDRQSARLKKLTEDLVESSKAASGSLPVELVPLDVKVLMEQAQGEYQSLLEEKGLTPVFTLPEEQVFVLADGKRFWRVLDNLMNNIAKYALTGTRVYGDLVVEEGVAKIVFRNISARPLPFSGEDLTERFVRGDASRNTEGSGLGLAIAKSFVELQKGRFEVICDGDLFKVQIYFDIIE